jgi:hypothetical protein
MRTALISLLLTLASTATAQWSDGLQSLPAYSEDKPMELELGGLPLDYKVLAISLHENLLNKQRVQREWEDFIPLLRNTAEGCAYYGFPVDTCLAIGRHETNWVWWMMSPSGRYCGAFQRAAQYSMPNPQFVATCSEHADCWKTCGRLRKDTTYVVSELIAYLQVMRSQGRHLPQDICNYQSGPYGPCTEAGRGYAARHREHHRLLVEQYRQTYFRLEQEQGVCK